MKSIATMNWMKKFLNNENNLLVGIRGFFTVSIFLFCFYVPASARDIVLLDKSNTASITEKEAILILPGFGTIMHNSKSFKANFKNQGYDVYIPDYISRKSIAKCAENVAAFYSKYELHNYKKVHVLSYIIGSWTLNTLLVQKNAPSNISTILYDRSPMQEMAPIVLVNENAFLSRILFGKLIRELSQTPYPTLTKKDKNIGIIVECKATKLMYKKRKSLPNYIPINWSSAGFSQAYDDITRLYVDHDDMYTHLEWIASSVFYFIKNQKFTPESERENCSQDPFEPYLKK